MYRPWENARQASNPVYPEYTRRGDRQKNERGRNRVGVLSLGKNCGQVEDPHCDYDDCDDLPPPYTTFSGYIHVKSLSLLKLILLIVWLTRECQLQMMEQICRSGNMTYHTCTRSPCAWLHMLMGGIPWSLQIDAICNTLLIITMISTILYLGALWIRERQSISHRRPLSTPFKMILIGLQSLLEFLFTLGIAYQLAVNIGKRQGGDAVWCVMKGMIVMAITLASFFLHIMTSLYICDHRQSIDYGKEWHGYREDRKRRVDDYDEGMENLMSGRRDEVEQQAFGRQNGQHGMSLLGAVPPNHMTQLPPGNSTVYYPHSGGTSSPVYYNEPCQTKSTSSEDSGGVSSVGYGRLRQALRQQAKASRAAGGGGGGGGRQHHHMMHKQSSASPHNHLSSSSFRCDLAAMASSATASAATLAASSVAGVAPPPVLLSPQAAAMAAASSTMDEAAGDYGQVRFLRQTELIRQSAGARSRKNSPAPSIHHRRSSREGLLLSPSQARLHAADSRPESAYLEVI